MKKLSSKVSELTKSNDFLFFNRISSYGRKKRELSSFSEEADRSRGDVLVTQAFLVTDKFGKKSGSEPATPKTKTPKLPEPVQIPVPSIPSPSPSHPWLQTSEEAAKDFNKYDFSFDQVGSICRTKIIRMTKNELSCHSSHF